MTQKFISASSPTGLKGLKLYSQRHTLATCLIDLGVEILTVSKLLGQADVRTRMSYTKASVDVMRKALERPDTLEGGGKKLVGDGKKSGESVADSEIKNNS